MRDSLLWGLYLGGFRGHVNEVLNCFVDHRWRSPARGSCFAVAMSP
jgi:hypothetical protein